MGQSQNQSSSTANINPSCLINKNSKFSDTSLVAFGRSKWNNHSNWSQQKFDVDKGQVYQTLPMGVLIKYPLLEESLKQHDSYNQNSSSFIDSQKETFNSRKFVIKFLKELSYTSQQDYQQSYIRNLQKMSQINQAILTLQDVKTRAQNTFCSTFYKIGLTFQYYQHSLLKQIKMRLIQKREFEQRQVWGVLCACVFAMGHLQRFQGRSHCALLPDDIKLTPDGGVKIMSMQMAGHGFYGHQNNNLYRFHNSCLAILASTIAHLLKFVNLDTNYENIHSITSSINNQQQQFLVTKELNEILDKNKIQNTIINNSQFECSQQMKELLQFMLDENTCVLDVEEKIKKLSMNYESMDDFNNNNNDEGSSYKNSQSNSSKKSYNNNKSSQGTPIVLKNSNSQNILNNNINNQKYKLLRPPNHTNNRKDNQNIQPSVYESKNYQISVKYDYMQPITQNNRQSQESSRYDINQNQINQQYQYECPRIVPQKNSKNFNEYPLNYRLDYDTTDQPSSIYNNDLTQEQELPDQNDIQSDEENNKQKDYRMKKTGLQIQSFNLNINKVAGNYENQQKLTYVTGKTSQKNYLNNNVIKRPQATTSSSFTQINIYKQSQQFKNSRSQDLFTNPSLLNQIKSDLQQIKMRKSQNNFAADNSRVSLMNNSYSNLNSSRKKYQTTQNKQLNGHMLLNKRQSESIIINGEPQKEKNKLNQKQKQKQKESTFKNIKQINSIFQDNSTGFKKKSKNNTKRQNQAQIDQDKINLPTTQVVSKQIKINQKDQPINYQQQPSVKSLSKYLQNDQSSKSLHPLQKQNSNLYFQQNKNQHDGKNLQYSRQTYAKGKYQGTKLNGMRHGHGTFFYSEGGKYVGQWYQNRMHGQGVLYYPNNQIAYEGRWEKDQLSGKGILYNQQVSILNTPYDYKNWQNVQEFWIKYIGEFLNDNKHGNGILFLSNGQKFQGQFKDDEVNGNGTLNRKDGRQIKGLWRKNKLIRLL